MGCVSCSPFAARVLAWFGANRRDLPWREPGVSPWGILVCEVMSQQTPVARVIGRWHDFMAAWPTPADLAAASPASVLRAWDRLGYPRRALNLQRAAAAVVEQHGGQLPEREDELLALPGVGAYTAAAVAAFLAYRSNFLGFADGVNAVVDAIKNLSIVKQITKIKEGNKRVDN